MAVKLAEKMAETAKVTVAWGDDEVDVSYHPNAVTPALLDKVEAAAEEGNEDVLGVLLEPVLDWWDVLDEKDKRLPVTQANIAMMPMRFLTAIQKAIMEDQNPPEDATSVGG